MDIRKLDKEKQQEIRDKIDIAIESFFEDIERIGIDVSYLTVYKFWKDGDEGEPEFIIETDHNDSVLITSGFGRPFHFNETKERKVEG